MWIFQILQRNSVTFYMTDLTQSSTTFGPVTYCSAIALLCPAAHDKHCWNVTTHRQSHTHTGRNSSAEAIQLFCCIKIKEIVQPSLAAKDNRRPYRQNLLTIFSSVVASSALSQWQLLQLNVKILLLQFEGRQVLVSVRLLWLMCDFHQFKHWWMAWFSSSSLSF